MQVDECAEVFLRALEEPIDGALLVGLDVIGVEAACVGSEVFPQWFAEAVFEEGQVLLQRLGTEGGAEKIAGRGLRHRRGTTRLR